MARRRPSTTMGNTQKASRSKSVARNRPSRTNLSTPKTAKKPGTRSNKGGAVRGTARARAVGGKAKAKGRAPVDPNGTPSTGYFNEGRLPNTGPRLVSRTSLSGRAPSTTMGGVIGGTSKRVAVPNFSTSRFSTAKTRRR